MEGCGGSRQLRSLLLLSFLCAGELLLAPTSAGCRNPGPRSPEPNAPTRVAFLQTLSPRDLACELSGITWDDQEGVYWAVSDALPRLVRLRPTKAGPVAIDGTLPLEVDGPWDGEGIALVGGRLFVSNEVGPRIDEFDKRSGRAIRQLTLPSHFAKARSNKSLEALAASPSGRFLFFANEAALESDGPLPSTGQGTMVRIVRLELATGRSREFPYLTDPTHAEDATLGVSAVVATGDDELFVLERAYARSAGNRIRVYRTRLEPEFAIPEALVGESLEKIAFAKSPNVGSKPIAKRLLFDVEHLTPPAGTAAAIPPQRSGLLENYEGLSFGPAPGGGRLLALISDDNAASEQTPRLLGLTGPW